MRTALSRGAISLLAGILATALVPTPAATAKVMDGYCSPTGDYCTSVVRRSGVTYLGISTFSFTGRYTLCTRTADGHGRECRRFRVRKNGDVYRSFVKFKKHFSPAGTGDYCASWHKFGARLGPKICFVFAGA